MTDNISVLISEEEIDKRIREIGKQISEEYKGELIHLVGVLRGGAFFTCELAKRIECDVTIDFVAAESYGNETVSSGVVKITKDLDENIENKHVIVVEDIIDTGRTLSHLLKIFSQRNPKSLKLCTMLNKPDRRLVDVTVDYNGFIIPDKFVVGYGLDYGQKYRNLPYIGVVEKN